MIKALFAAIAIFFASLFGGHQIATPSQPAAAVLAAPIVTPTEAPTPSFSPTQGNTTTAAFHRAPIEQTALAQGILLGTTTDTLSTQNLAQLQAEVAGLQVEISQLLSQRQTNYSSGAPAVITFPGNTIPSTYELPSTATVGGAPIATVNDVSQSSLWSASGSDIYYSGGNVGIGTTTPGNLLTVAGTGQFTGHVAIGNNAQVGPTDSNPVAALGGPYQSGLRIHNDLSGDLSVNAGAASLYDSIDDFSTYTHTGSGGLVSLGIDAQPVITASSTGTIDFLTGMDGAPSNYGSGNYGIDGIYAAPTNYGFAEGALNGVESFITSENGLVDSATGLRADGPNFNGGTVTNNYGVYIGDQVSGGSVQPVNNYQFFSNANGGNSPFVQLENGNVGIGTTSPQAKLDILTDTNTDALRLRTVDDNPFALVINNLSYGSGTDQAFTFFQSNDGTGFISDNNVGFIAFATNGSLGVATDTPWRTLSVTGSVGFDGLTGAVGAGSLCLSANKEVVYNAGSDNCLSSLRSTKHDINNLEISGTTTVAALVPVSFIYNNDASSTVRYGFIAEDTAAVDSHLGTYDQSGKLSGVDDRSILSIIVKALQEIIATITGFAHSFASDNITANNSLCVKKSDGTPVCITGDQLSAVLSGTGQSPSNAVRISAGSFTIASSSPSSNQGTTTSTTTDTVSNAATSTPTSDASSTPPTSPPTDATTSATTSTAQ